MDLYLGLIDSGGGVFSGFGGVIGGYQERNMPEFAVEEADS